LVKKHGPQLAQLAFPEGQVKNAEPGDTALHLACRLSNVDAVRTLLRSGMLIDAKNAKSQRALDLASGSVSVEQVSCCGLCQKKSAFSVYPCYLLVIYIPIHYRCDEVRRLKLAISYRDVESIFREYLLLETFSHRARWLLNFLDNVMLLSSPIVENYPLRLAASC
jgi:hypothetical protein